MKQKRQRCQSYLIITINKGSFIILISQQKQSLYSTMSNSHLNIQAEFFQHNPQQQLPTIPPHSDYLQHPIKIHETSVGNTNPMGTANEGQATNTSSPNKFYEEYKRIFSVSYNLQIQKGRLKDVLQELQARVSKLQDKLNVQNSTKPKDTKNSCTIKKQINSEQNKNKRSRRTAQQIQKKYKCEVAFCERYYGSEGSLQQHIKLKHPEILVKESEDEYVPHHNKDLQQHSSL